MEQGENKTISCTVNEMFIMFIV